MRGTLPPIFALTSLDSGALKGPAAILHRMPSAGRWSLTVWNDVGAAVGATTVHVREVAGPAATVDLDALCRPFQGGDGPSLEPTLGTGGMLCLQAQNLREAVHVTLSPNLKSGADWDSRVLESGDRFGFALVRPGTYGLTNRASGQRFDIAVLYPDPREIDRFRLRRTETVNVLFGNGPGPSRVEVVPGQGIVVETLARARFQLDLMAADDGPADLEDWRQARERSVLAQLRGRGPRPQRGLGAE
jgi:hypothetical protein